MIGSTGYKRAMGLRSILELHSSHARRDEALVQAPEKSATLRRGWEVVPQYELGLARCGAAGKPPRTGAIPVGGRGRGEGIVSRGRGGGLGPPVLGLYTIFRPW